MHLFFSGVLNKAVFERRRKKQFWRHVFVTGQRPYVGMLNAWFVCRVHLSVSLILLPAEGDRPHHCLRLLMETACFALLPQVDRLCNYYHHHTTFWCYNVDLAEFSLLFSHRLTRVSSTGVKWSDCRGGEKERSVFPLLSQTHLEVEGRHKKARGSQMIDNLLSNKRQLMSPTGVLIHTQTHARTHARTHACVCLYSSSFIRDLVRFHLQGALRPHISAEHQPINKGGC